MKMMNKYALISFLLVALVVLEISSASGYMSSVSDLNPSPKTLKHYGMGLKVENTPQQGLSYSDPSSIAVKWKYNAGGEILFPPVVGKDGTIYIISKPFNTLHAINPDGTLKWKYDVEYKVSFAPVVSADGTVYLCVEDPKKVGYLYAINNGILKWKIKAEFESFIESWREVKIISGKIENPPIVDEQGTIYFKAKGELEEAIFAVNDDGTLRYKIANHKIEKWGKLVSGIEEFGDLVIRIRIWGSELITARNGTVYITADAIAPSAEIWGFYDRYDIIVAIGPDGKIKWVSELSTYKGREWEYIVAGKEAMYLVLEDKKRNIILQALGYDGKIRYEFRGDDYWNRDFYYSADMRRPIIGKDDTVYIMFSNEKYGDFSIMYAINSDGTLKWKSKLPQYDHNYFLYCDRDGRVYRLWSWLWLGPCSLYVINPNGELSWKYEYEGCDPYNPPLISEDGTIYLIWRRRRGGCLDYYTIDILNLEGKLIKRLKVSDLLGVGGAALEGSRLSPDGTILAILSMEDRNCKLLANREILVAIGPPPLKKTMLTMNINPSKIAEKVSGTITITGRLTDEGGNGLNGRVINIYRDGNIIGSCTTDSNGYYKYKWEDVYLEKGNYEITVRFDGDSTYAASSESTTLTVTPSVLTLSPLEGWQNKEIIYPIYRRLREDPGRVVIGVGNKRDMWYLVKVFRRIDNRWEEIKPWKRPYLPPYGTLSFSYAPAEGEEVRVEVWNDLNDKTLYALVFLDFMMRSCIGTPLPLRSMGENGLELEAVDPEEFFSDLTALYDGFKGAIGYLATGQWRKALEKVGDTLVSEAMRNLVKKLVIEMGVEGTEASPEIIAKVALDASKGIGVVSYFAKNIGLWWHFLENIQRELFAEEITSRLRG